MRKQVSKKNFFAYAQLNPELLRLEKRIKEYAKKNKNNKNYCANSAWYGIFKRELCTLVGWSATIPELKSSEAYDTVYIHLYNLLPDCQHDSIYC